MTELKTWELAASDAAYHRGEHEPPHNFLTNSNAWLLDEAVNCLEEIRFGNLVEGHFYELLDIGLQGYTNTVGGAVDPLAQVLTTITSKQHDYGHDNILWAGVDGLVVRIHDKVARIKNLQKRAERNAYPQFMHEIVETAINEPLADSWLDIAGYAVIGVMLERDTFELPLSQDVVAISTYDPNTQQFIDDVTIAAKVELAVPLFSEAQLDRIEEIVHDVLHVADLDEATIKTWIKEAIADHERIKPHYYYPYVYVQPQQPSWPYRPPFTPKVTY